MSIIQVKHIQSACKARFSSLIDMSDVKSSDAEKENKFLSRAVAAFSLASIAKIDDTTAAQAVTDEYGDDGIDAFHFDRVEHIAYIVQSKWSKDGTGSIDVGSVLKFVQGIHHILEDKITLLGKKLRAKGTEIQESLSDSQATFILLIAYSGKSPLSDEAKTPLNQLLAELNDDGDMVSLQVMKQKELHAIVEKSAMGVSVDLTVMLHEFGKIAEPYTAYYGQVDVTDLASWSQYGDHLYHKNIRSFKGSTDVNDAIVATIKESPDNFLYFNNGITLLCSELDKKPLGGKTKTSGVFDCKGASVINGAQTVGSILTALAAANSSVSATGSTARVMIRLISLADCPPDFASDVTRAANTQNRIEKRDFAALDPEQTRLSNEMLLSLGKEYVFRTGDRSPSPDKGCTIDEAAVALSCAHSDATHAVNAKQAIGRLYEDITKPPYTLMFNSFLSAVRLWHSVEILRVVDARLKIEQKARDGKEKLCAIHGNRVILHLVFRELASSSFEDDNFDASHVGDSASGYLDMIAGEIAKNYQASYIGNIFKNITKCKLIVGAIHI